MNRIESPLFGISVDSIYELLFFTYSLFLIGFFVSRTAPGHYKFYYFAMLPLAIPILADGLGQLKKDTLFRLLVLYIAYMAFSAIWSDLFSLRGLKNLLWKGYMYQHLLSLRHCYTPPTRQDVSAYREHCTWWPAS